MEEMIENTNKQKQNEKENPKEEHKPDGPRSSSTKPRAEVHQINKEIPKKSNEESGQQSAKTNQNTEEKPSTKQEQKKEESNPNVNKETKKPQKVTKSTSNSDLEIKKNDYDEDTIKIPQTKQDVLGGSNSYVFSGKITEDGQPILGNDPHLHNSMPGFWYMVNMKIKNGQHFIGGTHPGNQAILIGQNSFLAWGFTIGFADIADFIKIPKSIVNKKDYSFKLDNTKHQLKKRAETIYLDAKKTKSITANYLDSEVGPVLNGYEHSLFAAVHFGAVPDLLDDKYYYILRASFTKSFDSTFKGLANLNFMSSFEEVPKILSQISMSLSIVYADVKGNIGYQLTGKIPIRHKRGEGSYPILIEHEKDLIAEYIPFNELPFVNNPPKGYIVTCNNLVIDEDYKYILQGGFIGDQRIKSIERTIDEHLKQKKKITTKFVIEKITGSVRDEVCKDILSKIKKIGSTENSVLNIIKELSNFNCLMIGDSTEALKYNVFLTELYNRLYYFKGNHTPLYHSLLMTSENKENYLQYKLDQYAKNPKQCITEYNQTCSKFLNEVYQHMMTFIKQRLGSQMSNWKWSNLNRKYYPHLPFSEIPFLNMLSSRLVKTNGNVHCPKTSGFEVYERKYLSSLSSNFKFVTHLNKKEDLHMSVDCGNNGRLFTKNFDARCNLHEEGKLIHFDSSFKQNYTMRFSPA